MFKKEVVSSFKNLGKNPWSVIPFLFEAIVVYLFMRLFAMTYLYDFFVMEDVIYRIFSSIHLILLNLLLLLLVVGFAEASGLGSVFHGEKKGKKFWVFGNQLWWRMIKITLLTFLIYAVLLLPAAIPLLFVSNATVFLILSVIFITYALFASLFASITLKFSKFVLVADDKKSVFQTIKKSIKLALKKPKPIIMAMIVSGLINLPTYIIYNYFPIFGLFLVAVLGQAWSANFFFIVYKRIENGNTNKKHSGKKRGSKKASR